MLLVLKPFPKSSTSNKEVKTSDEISVTLPDAVTLLASSDSNTVGKWLYLLTLTGKWNEALEYARSIPDPIKRSEAFAFISQALSKLRKNGDANAVATLAVEAEDQVYKNSLARIQPAAVVPITTALIDAGRMDDAIKFAKRYKGPSLEVIWSHLMLSKGLKCIGREAEAKQIAFEALAAVNNMKEPMMQPLALIEVVRLLARLNETEKALKITQGMDDPVQQNQAFIAIAKETFQLGFPDKAKKIIEEALDKGRATTNAEARTQALAMISQTLVNIGENEKANDLAYQAKNSMPSNVDSSTRFTFLLLLSNTFTKIGRTNEANEIISEAVSIARLLDRADLRANFSIDAAKMLFKIGRANEANELLEEALNFAKQIPSDIMRSSAILNIAKARAKFSLFRSALEIINFCSTSDHKLAAYVAIAREAYIQRNHTPITFFEKNEDEKDWFFEMDFSCST